MTDEASRETVLPPNRSLLETGIDLAVAKVVERIVPPFPELMNPMATPAEFLPYLAADRGVTDWDPASPESERRLTTALAWGIKRQAGTRAALLQAVESMELEGKVISWHERTPRGAPYSFTIEATVNRPWLLGDFPRLWRRVNDAKSERDLLELALITETSGGVRASGAVGTPFNVGELDLGGRLPEIEISGAVASQGAAGTPASVGDLDLAGSLPDGELAITVAPSGGGQFYNIDDYDLEGAK